MSDVKLDMGSGTEVTFEIEGETFIMGDDNFQVIDLGDPNVSQEVEVVTVEAPSSSSYLQGPGQRINIKNVTSKRGKAPALLRNSRRFPQEQQIYIGGPMQKSPDLEKSLSSNNFNKIENNMTSPLQHAILLDDMGQPTNQVVVLAPNESGEYTIVERSTQNSNEFDFVNSTANNDLITKEEHNESFQSTQNQTIIICQDAEGNQFQQLMDDEEGILVPVDSTYPFQLEDVDGNGTIYFEETSGFDSPSSNNFITADTVHNKKRKANGKKNSKKPIQVIVGPDGKPLKKRGQAELKCMEKDCLSFCYNVAELRKHLITSHGFQFDEEIVHFQSDEEFKSWRQTYERERMVSFIYRGGTKRVAKDQAVTYLICHRSGHYKPTMLHESQRKRKLKPQGSCKMGGYCTAGIKLMKNTDTGIVKMEICHTHYGHPLDSDAIPHLRVTPTLRKVILSKFKEGLSFTEVLAYIHHNPDKLEGLRLVDRRAVRNIYDTWKHPSRRSKQIQKEIDELPDVISKSRTSNNSHKLGENRNTLIPSGNNEQQEAIKSIVQFSKLKAEDDFQYSNLEQPEDSEDELSPPLLLPLTESHVPTFDSPTKRSLRSMKIDDERPPPLLENAKSGETSKMSIEQEKGSYSLRPHRKVELYKTSPKKSHNNDNEEDERKTSPSNKRQTTKRPADLEKIANKRIKLGQPVEVIIPPSMTISEKLDEAIENLCDHGESGPTVILYKPFGGPVKYGEIRRELKKEDFCLAIQTPVQRQLLIMLPNIIGFDVIETVKSPEKHLKLAFIMIIDEFREPVPVAWLITSSIQPRILSSFFRAVKRECGDLKTQYMMTPRLSDAFKMWKSVFSEKPQNLQSEIEYRRDLKELVKHEFSTERGRREMWEALESIIAERQIENLDISYLEEKFEPIFDKVAHTGEFIEKFERDWLSRVEEWAMYYRYNTSVNIMGIAHSFCKLRKFIHFKGTNKLNESFQHILKIGYDKCFLRSKRMFKGDQKFSLVLDNVLRRHKKAQLLKEKATIIKCQNTEDSWIVNVSKVDYVISSVNSPCQCKVVCKICKVCVHMYTCSCNDNSSACIMCEHIHFVHCDRNQIVDEPEFITADLTNEGSELDSAFGNIKTNETDEGPGAIINVEAVLKASGLFHKSGLQPDQIVSITDADTQTIIYEHCSQTSSSIPTLVSQTSTSDNNESVEEAENVDVYTVDSSSAVETE